MLHMPSDYIGIKTLFTTKEQIVVYCASSVCLPTYKMKIWNNYGELVCDFKPSNIAAGVVYTIQPGGLNPGNYTVDFYNGDILIKQFGFGVIGDDQDIVKGDGFTIKRSQLDEVVSSARANAAHQGKQLNSNFEASILSQLISVNLLLLQATDADRTKGKVDSDNQCFVLIKRFGTEEALQRQLISVGMTENKLRANALQEATAKATLKRCLNVAVSDDEVREYYIEHPADFLVPATANRPAYTLALGEISPSTGLTIAEELRDALVNIKVSKLAPDYVKQLRTSYHVQILDAILRAEFDRLTQDRS